jgi:hypothetical protein
MHSGRAETSASVFHDCCWPLPHELILMISTTSEIGTNRTNRPGRVKSVVRGRPEVAYRWPEVAF